LKQFEPNPLQQELARNRQAGPHPDSDLLTAFAEGTLLERERRNVFAHLATCADCRELLSVATAAAPSPPTGLRPFLLHRSERPQLRAWLPWASVAAGIIVVCSAGLVYKQKLELKHRASIAAENAPGLPSATIPQAHPSPAAEPMAQISETASSPAAEPLKAAQPDSGAQSASAAKALTGGSGAQPAATARTGSAFANAETARGMSKLSAAAGSARPHWRIDSLGHAERSFGDGAWHPVFPNESAKMRVVSVSDPDVWIGGENSRLYHSTDKGNTFSTVALPMKNGDEHAIVHIHFQTRETGAVEAADGTSWTTTDGGASWQ
jgi:hypothetical protein